MPWERWLFAVAVLAPTLLQGFFRPALVQVEHKGQIHILRAYQVTSSSAIVRQHGCEWGSAATASDSDAVRR